MAVIATAGHVDHGKSTLVRLLTGQEPDRWAEERRRGLTIDLGYAWTDIDGRRVSLVDVPGHEHFTANMLAGLAPVRAVMFVVAADDGWCPQSQEHARAIAALGITHVLLVVTRCDLSPGDAAARDSADRFVALGVSVAETVLVSGATGEGVPELRAALGRLAAVSGTGPDTDRSIDSTGAGTTQAEEPRTEDTPVRLWVDRSFTIRGAGTVVTGTLEAGTIRVGDSMVLRDRHVTVRGLQSCGEQVVAVTWPVRVAVNLRGVAAAEVSRGDALLTESWSPAATIIDVIGIGDGGRLPRALTLHVGTAAVPVRTQRLSDGQVRLRLSGPVPLVPGDRAVLRDPGMREVFAGVEVAVVDPPTRRDRRGEGRRGPARSSGQTSPGGPAGPGRPQSPQPTSPEGAPSGRAARRVPDGIRALGGWLAAHPLQAPSRDQLDGWALTTRDLADAADRGVIVRVGGVVLAGDALGQAATVIRSLGQPFTVGDAARALGTSRRVAVPLLERLDTTMVTRRLADGRREVRPPAERKPPTGRQPVTP